jgi:ATP-dependent DNA helicase RecG
MHAWLEGGVRQEKRSWPEPAIREAVVNAFTHRDWSMYGSEVEISIFPDRLEVISPGPLPNGITVEGMRLGTGFARNPLLRDMLRGYRYVDDRGLGVPRKIIRGMREHNSTEPDLVPEDHRFMVRLWKRRSSA